MTRETIIEHFTSNIKQYQQYARNITKGEPWEDLFQECTLMLLELSEEKLLTKWNPTQGLKPFFLTVLSNQYNSKTSKFHSKYRKQNLFISNKGKDIVYNEQRTEIEDFTIDPKEIETARANVHLIKGEMFPHPVHEMIFDLYVKAGSLRKALLQIPDQWIDHVDLKLVHKVVREYRMIIKKQLNKNL